MASSVYHRSNRHANSNVEADRNAASWFFCFGDSLSITSYLKNKNGWAWTLPKFLNALFRGFGQVVFANNPFSGILILTALIWFNLNVGLLVLGSASIAVLTAVVVNIHPKSIIAGLDSYLCCVLISNGLTNILSSFKPSIPILSIPFHILVFAIFSCLKPSTTALVKHEIGIINGNSTVIITDQSINEDVLYNRTSMVSNSDEFFANINGTASDQFYNWDTLQNVALGVALSSGQVFGVADLISSLLIYAAILIYSPILTFMCFHGAVIATGLGLFLTPFPNEEIFLGVWGFNGFLSSGAIGVFYIFNSYSLINGTANAAFTAVIQFALTSYFTAHNIPIFGLPFILSTLLFICVTSNGPQLVRVKTVTFPEQQRSSYFKWRTEEEIMTERNLINP